MSTQVLTSTTFVGIDIAINRKPVFMNKVQENVSGKETRIALRIIPRWNWEVQFNFIRSTSQAQYGSSAVAGQEFNALNTFYNSRSGGFDSFLWLDPEDNNAVLSSANLISTAAPGTYQLTRSLGSGGFNENIFAPNAVSQVFLVGSSNSSGSTMGVTVGLWGSTIPGTITFSTFTPSTAAFPYVTFSYYWPVRWDKDEMPLTRFGLGWFEVKKMSFTSII